MKKYISITVLLAFQILGCSKDNNQPNNTNNPTFDGKINGKWQIIPPGCPIEWGNGLSQYVVFSSNGKLMASFPAKDIGPTYSNWSGNIESILYINSDKVILDSISNEVIKFKYKNNNVTLKKISNEQCPSITLIEKDPMGTSSLVFKGNPEFITQSDIVTNMTISSYWQDKGVCFFSTPLNNTNNYITFSKNGCPTISFKNEVGIWKKQ